MLEKLSQSSGNILAYKVIGKLTEEDYTAVAGDIEAFRVGGNQYWAAAGSGSVQGARYQSLGRETQLQR